VKSSQTQIDISLRDQKLVVLRDGETLRTYPVSSSRFGIGSEEGSMKTPIGHFQVGKKIGHDMPSGTIFKSRVPLRAEDPPPETEDWVTSRILWLDGMEEHNSNTRDRFIYIHGTKHEDKIGRPDSHGCIRMRNEDVIELFQLVDEGTPVLISE
jgi:L,D-transpeptidase YbiS